MSRFGLRLLASTIVLAGAADAAAQDAAQDAKVAEARTALDDKKWDEAIRLAEPLRKSSAPSVRADALEIVGVASLMAGRAGPGKQAVSELYDLEPAFELGDTSLPESVTSVFKAEQAAPHPRKVSLKLEPAAATPTSFDLTAAGTVNEVRIACRVVGGKAFVPLATTRSGDAFRFQLAASRPHTCFALAMDADGLLVGRLGSRAQPVDVTPRTASSSASAPSGAGVATTPARAPDAPITSQWWFWTALGAVVAVGAVTVIVVVASGKSDDTTAEQTGQKTGTLFTF